MNHSATLKAMLCLGAAAAAMALAPAQAMTLAPAPLPLAAIATGVETVGYSSSYSQPSYPKSYSYHRPRYRYHAPRPVYHAPPVYHPPSY